ncbi:hypothetical protein ACQKWADRAFT_300976 [Trichoderma austrokoningii]
MLLVAPLFSWSSLLGSCMHVSSAPRTEGCVEVEAHVACDAMRCFHPKNCHDSGRGDAILALVVESLCEVGACRLSRGELLQSVSCSFGIDPQARLPWPCCYGEP